MGAGYGFAGHIGFAKETSGGTPVAVTNYVEGMSEDLAASIDRFEPINIHGKYSEPDDQAGIRRIGGNIAIPVNPQTIGLLLLGVMGIQSNTVVLSGALHRHEFKMRTNEWDTKHPLQPFTFEIFRDVASAQQYAGINISQLQLSVAPNQELRATMNVIGRSTTDIAATTPAFVATPAAPFTFDTCSISIGGAAADNIEGITLTLNNQLAGVPTLNNSTSISRIRRSGPQLVRLAGTMSFESIDEYVKFRNQTEAQIKVSFFKSNSYSMIIDIPRFVYTAYPLGMPGRDRQTVSFEGIGRYSTGSASAIKIDLYNTTSGF